MPGGAHLAALPNKMTMAVTVIAGNWTIRNAIALAVPWVNGSRLIDGKAEVNDGYRPDMLCRLAHRHHLGTKPLI